MSNDLWNELNEHINPVSKVAQREEDHVCDPNDLKCQNYAANRKAFGPIRDLKPGDRVRSNYAPSAPEGHDDSIDGPWNVGTVLDRPPFNDGPHHDPWYDVRFPGSDQTRGVMLDSTRITGPIERSVEHTHGDPNPARGNEHAGIRHTHFTDIRDKGHSHSGGDYHDLPAQPIRSEGSSRQPGWLLEATIKEAGPKWDAVKDLFKNPLTPDTRSADDYFSEDSGKGVRPPPHPNTEEEHQANMERIRSLQRLHDQAVNGPGGQPTTWDTTQTQKQATDIPITKEDWDSSSFSTEHPNFKNHHDRLHQFGEEHEHDAEDKSITVPEEDEDDGDWRGHDDDDFHIDFADPGGNSALRAETKDNPRNHPCPSCGTENVLTPADVAQGYQCDGCADRAERGYD